MFWERAGERGHGEAAFQVGAHYAARRQYWDAASWLSRAAMRGHPEAQREFTEIHRRLTFSGVVPLGPDMTYYAPPDPQYAPGSPFSLDGVPPLDPLASLDGLGEFDFLLPSGERTVSGPEEGPYGPRSRPS